MKILRDDLMQDVAAIAALQRECEHVRALDHPNILRVDGVHRTARHTWIVAVALCAEQTLLPLVAKMHRLRSYLLKAADVVGRNRGPAGTMRYEPIGAITVG